MSTVNTKSCWGKDAITWEPHAGLSLCFAQVLKQNPNYFMNVSPYHTATTPSISTPSSHPECADFPIDEINTSQSSYRVEGPIDDYVFKGLSWPAALFLVSVRWNISAVGVCAWSYLQEAGRVRWAATMYGTFICRLPMTYLFQLDLC